jgi:mandelamide amidase
MARTVRDVALADSVITGTPIGLDRIELAGLRIGVPRAYFHDVIDKRVQRAIKQSIRRLERAGATIVYADIPAVGEDTVNSSLALNFYESVPGLATYLAQSNTGVSIEQLAKMVASPDVAALLGGAISDPIPDEVYKGVLAAVEQVFRPIYIGYLMSNDLDAVLFPSNPVPAPTQNAETVHINGVDVPVFQAFFSLGHYVPLVGAPAVSLPMGKSWRGLPVGGIDIAGLPGDDRRVLAIAAAVERTLPPVRPPVRIQPLPFWWLR